ncbi:conserved hypothetical protein [Cupriavidus phytorum]|uniref:DUF2188 domain-containing protein n=3 Tax=Cupriavidus TaxID=106589 RepID=A0A375BEF0_9BURK|nr:MULTISPECIES: DUF2188 domain-containing protein [Cupriavidus]AMR77581.1 hypothetical protein A2G96_07430 [Cupriavidus nantongensis]PZX28052.1 uncharacterized protein DUF2188 [Cupriavidus alkaliphilus]SOY41954.1 conserved hypothetical protein [Cupriavidus taiwanensis]
MPAKNIHVVPLDNGWAIESEDGAGGRQLYATQEDAIAAGTEKARQLQAELLVHGRDGRIRMRNSFGNDPRDIQG